eukprot:2778026-Rhodomonas_salina.1
MQCLVLQAMSYRARVALCTAFQTAGIVSQEGGRTCCAARKRNSRGKQNSRGKPGVLHAAENTVCIRELTHSLSQFCTEDRMLSMDDHWPRAQPWPP